MEQATQFPQNLKSLNCHADHNFLLKLGVSGIFGPGTVIAESAINILKKLIRNLTPIN